MLAIALLMIGCKRDEMANDSKLDPYEPIEFFADGSSSRPLVPGTVARGQTIANGVRASTQPADTGYPFPITYVELKRGQQRYDIFCAVCHGRSGAGDGMIVQRGFVRPPAFFPIAEHQTQFPDLHPREQALLNAAPGHIVNVIANGYGAMYSYSDRVPTDDRWRIAAYIKTLQLARNVKPEQLTPEMRNEMIAMSAQSTTQPATNPSGGSH